MKKLKLTLITMTLMLSITISALADGEMGFPKSESTLASSIVAAIFGLF